MTAQHLPACTIETQPAAPSASVQIPVGIVQSHIKTETPVQAATAAGLPTESVVINNSNNNSNNTNNFTVQLMMTTYVREKSCLCKAVHCHCPLAVKLFDFVNQTPCQ